MGKYLTGDMGSIFIQPDGPNGQVYWLGCHELGDVAEPSGDVARTYCPDPKARGKWITATRTQGAPGEATFDITFPVGKTADWLEILARRGCRQPIYVNSSECGERNIYEEYDRGFVAKNALVTNKTRTGLATRGTDGGASTEATRTFSFSAEAIEDYFSLVSTRWPHAATTVLNDVIIAGRDRCLGACGAPAEPCDILYSVDTAAVAAVSQPYRSTDGGKTWAATAAAPFAVNEVVKRLAAFPINSTTMRIICGRGTTDAVNPAEIGYSDDNGATWTLVNVGATNGEFINDIFAWSREAIWVATDTGAGAAGNVYKSIDAGATWTLSLAGATDALNCVTFASDKLGLALGDTNEIQWTEDGGDHWTVITGPAAQAAANCLCGVVLDAYRWFIGYSDGEVWYTQDGGATWAQRVLPLPTGATAIAAVNDMAAIDEYNLWLAIQATVGGNPYAALMRTTNGGYSWQSWLAPAQCVAGGMCGVAACSYNQAFGAGGVVAATGLILEVAEN